MSVSTGGVSSGKGSAPVADAWSILAIASDPKKTSERLTELIEATTVHMKAIEAHGKVDQIDGLLGEAKKANASARDKVSKAQDEAQEIIAKAERQGKKVLATAAAEIEKNKDSVKRSRERVLAREKEVATREAALKPNEDKAREAMTEAATMKESARRVQSSYEIRIRRLKSALKEAGL